MRSTKSMLLTAVSSVLINPNQIIPGLHLAFLSNLLELRVLVLTSLLFQTVLIFLGSQRKHNVGRWLQFILWCFYLSADQVATAALGILSKESKDSSINPNFVIIAIWAPFLIVHLGGPDSITAYALEDNELWLRHFIGLLYQVAFAAIVVYKSLNGSNLKFVVFPLIVAGIIKYGERTLSLRKGSSENFRESVLPPPDPGPSYAKLMDEYTARKAEGYKVSLKYVIENSTPELSHSQRAIVNNRIPGAYFLYCAYSFFKIFECLFADLILSHQDHKISHNFFGRETWENTFEVIEIELGLMYDILYTKACVTYSRLGIFFKLMSFSLTLSAFIIFYYMVDKEHINYDHIITFVLFVGAIFLEIYAFIVLLCSTWTMLWLSMHKGRGVDLLYKSISCFQRWFNLSHTKRWSNLVSQYNLISFCLKVKSIKYVPFQKKQRIYQFLERFHYTPKEEVTPKLKELIFDQLKKKHGEALGIESCKKLCALRGDRALKGWNCHAIDWSIKVDFDQSILLWHIATDICSNLDKIKYPNCADFPSSKISTLLSNYMLYLLVKCPFMFPSGIGKMIFDHTCAEASEMLEEKKYISKREEVCNMIHRVNTEIPASEVKGDRNQSVLFDACRLAKSIQSLEIENNWSGEQKWEMISHVWVEILCHAASQCRGRDHAKQLGKGGELLTHVWLLMAHLGITDKISQGTKVRLVVK